MERNNVPYATRFFFMHVQLNMRPALEKVVLLSTAKMPIPCLWLKKFSQELYKTNNLSMRTSNIQTMFPTVKV